ncbi:hypothetical protein [Altibacter sp. HG106]|uniref:hypothetical protein n=1 Tax=Altibacter sp. HG106 TaxID=3023937 RepID=UPI00235003E7|nr:hypothetical protein [Altibacter sp. HG106]MDC7994033.1 hypothetical protein [Altibacter sp. HG106]
MKIIVITFLLLLPLSLISQINIEFYTQYGYHVNFDKEMFKVIDGEQFYWYLDINLNEVKQPKEYIQAITYNSSGHLYRIDYANQTYYKWDISEVKIIKKDGLVKTILYPQTRNSWQSAELTRENGITKLSVCIRTEKISGSEICRELYMHSTNRFEDNNFNYLSKLPSQKLD